MKKMLLLGLMMVGGCGTDVGDEPIATQEAAKKVIPSYCGVNIATNTLSGLCIGNNDNALMRCPTPVSSDCVYGTPVSTVLYDAVHCNSPHTDIVCTPN